MNKILDLSKKLIAIESTKNKPKELDNVLALISSELSSFNCKKFTRNGVKSLLFYNTADVPEKFKIVLNGHIDVVPGKKDQFIPRIEGNTLWGRGAHDMKGSVAALIKVFQDTAKKVDFPLGLQIVTDEETGGYNGTAHQVDEGVRADFGIFGEPTNLGITNQAKGIIWLKITTTGKSAHAAYHWNSHNPVLETKRIIDGLEKEFPLPTKACWSTTVIPTMIGTSNETYNKIAGDCILCLDVRYTPEEKETIMPRIKKHLPEFSDLEVVVNEPPHYTSPNNSYLKKLALAQNKIIGRLPLREDQGGSDAKFFERVGCPSITFGPIGGGLHSDHEWVDIKSLKNYHLILKEFLISLN